MFIFYTFVFVIYFEFYNDCRGKRFKRFKDSNVQAPALSRLHFLVSALLNFLSKKRLVPVYMYGELSKMRFAISANFINYPTNIRRYKYSQHPPPPPPV